MNHTIDFNATKDKVEKNKTMCEGLEDLFDKSELDFSKFKDANDKKIQSIEKDISSMTNKLKHGLD